MILWDIHIIWLSLGKDRIHVTPSMTVTSAPVTRVTSRLENMGQKLYKKNFFHLQHY
jgi:hypothetical protein